MIRASPERVIGLLEVLQICEFCESKYGKDFAGSPALVARGTGHHAVGAGTGAEALAELRQPDRKQPASHHGAVLLRLQAYFGIDLQFFSEDEESRVVAELREITAGVLGPGAVPLAELQSVAQQLPAF